MGRIEPWPVGRTPHDDHHGRSIPEKDMSPKVTQIPHAAFCEDLDEDANTILPETRKVANVAAKRSRPDLPNALSKSASADGASDSGYSSHTAATLGSGDSAPKESRQRTALRVDTSARERDSRPPISERTRDGSDGHESKSRPPLSRSSSKSRRSDKGRHYPGTCAECDYLGYHPATPVDATRAYDFPPIPPSPQSARYPPPAMMFPQEIHNTPAQPRISRSQSYRQAGRPVSIHGGTFEQIYIPIPAPPRAPHMYDYGPPLSASAWSHHAPPSYPPPGYAIPPSPYAQTPVASAPQRLDPPPPSPYDQARPAPRSRPSETKTIRRSSMYGTPVVQQPEPAHNGPPLELRTAQKGRRQTVQGEPTYDRDEDYYRMPPPPPPQTIPVRSRPAPRKSSTTNSTPTVRRPVEVDYSDTRAEVAGHTSLRRGSKDSYTDQRPSLNRADGTRKTVSYSNGSGSAKVAAESRAQRRTTLDGHERSRDLEQNLREIEAYQNAKGPQTIPLTADALKNARRNHKSSDSASFTSSSKGSDVKTKSGSGVASRPENDGITMNIQGVKLDLSSDSMGDKRINIRQKGERGLELHIDGKKSRRYLVTREEPPSFFPRREIESGRRSRDEHGSDRASRRSSRSGYSGRAFIGD